ncbi:VWA domain-containing protein [Tersicoccus sp. MR15.9]|uniref:vWA domain-containing protein n=1 Tax=Tersicoccus mangrovi TaxID=3121635 RepID=UPI002FE6C35B
MTTLPVLPVPALSTLGVLLLAFCGWRWWAERRAGARPLARSWLWRAGLVALVVTAAFRPGIPGAGTTQNATADLDVFFVVDTTASVVAEDYGGAAGGNRPRLDGMRQDVGRLVAALPGASFSLLTFDSSALIRLPLTGDATAVTTAMEVLRPEVTTYSRGSSVTIAAPLLTQQLERARAAHPERARVVFYFGDGEQTDGLSPVPFTVPSGAVDGGAVLGYGTAAGGRMKANEGYIAGERADYVQDRSVDPPVDAVSRIDENRLRTIAGQLGVPYTHRAAGDPIENALTATDPGRLAAQAGSIAGRYELYWILAAAAAGIVARELYLLGADVLRLSSLGRRARSSRGPEVSDATR